MQTLPGNKYSKTHHKRQIKYHGKKKRYRNCKEREVIYAAECFKDKVWYIEHTEQQLSECFSKHRYDINNMPDNSEFEKHFHESHNMNDNLNVTILQNNIKTAAAQSIMETNGFVD